MRTLSADWMANTSKPDSDLQSFPHGGEESKVNFFYPRPVAPTAAQVHSDLPAFAFVIVLITIVSDRVYQSF